MIQYSEIEEIIDNLYQPDKFSRDIIRKAFIDYIYTFKKEFEIEIEESNERIEDLENEIEDKDDEVKNLQRKIYSQDRMIEDLQNKIFILESKIN